MQESEATELKAVIVANTAVKQRLWSLSDYLDIPSKAAAAGVNEQVCVGGGCLCVCIYM